MDIPVAIRSTIDQHFVAIRRRRAMSLCLSLIAQLVVAGGVATSVASAAGSESAASDIRPAQVSSLPLDDSSDLYWDDRFAAPGGGNPLLEQGLNGPVNAVSVAGTEVYVGGAFTQAGGVAVNRIAKWDGTSWSPLGSGLNDEVWAIAVRGTEVYVGGAFTQAGGAPAHRIAKWDGTAWSALGGGMDNAVRAIEFVGSSLIAGGNFSTAGGSPSKSVAKWDGTQWTSLGGGIEWGVRCLKSVGSDLYAGGPFSMAGGMSVNLVAKWDGIGWSPLGDGLYSPSSPSVSALEVIGDALFAGGYFTSSGPAQVRFIGQWNGSSWSAVGGGLGNSVTAMAAADGRLYAVGSFRGTGSTLQRIGVWDGTSWSSVGSGLNNFANAVALRGEALFIGGMFTTAGGKPSSHFAVYSPRVNTSEQLVGSVPDRIVVGDDPHGFYRPALVLATGTTVAYSGGLPAAVTLARAPRTTVGGTRVNGAFTLAPSGMSFGGDGARLRVEFSEDDVALFPGATYSDFRAVRFTEHSGLPGDAAVEVAEVLSSAAPVPVRIERGRQIYAIEAVLPSINSTYGAVPAASGVAGWRSY